MRVCEWNRRPVDELVDEQPVPDEQRRDHRPRRNAIRLDEQGADHEIDQDRAENALEGLPRRAAAGATRRTWRLVPSRLRDDVLLGAVLGRRRQLWPR